MSLSCRRYLVDREDRIVRLKGSVYELLLRDPLHHSMPDLAGQRVRVAEVTVEMLDRLPLRVVQRVYFVLAFDEHGRIDLDRLRRQQCALALSVLDTVLDASKGDDDVRDAAERFIAQGGRWRPAAALARMIDSAALGVPAEG